jgi:ACS family D-galactonate transporter-like MFS transporter
MEHSNQQTTVRYWMLSLVFINVVINYLDRTNLSVAAPELSKELELSNAQLGMCSRHLAGRTQRCKFQEDCSPINMDLVSFTQHV